MENIRQHYSSEQVQSKNHLLETLLIIAGFAIATYSNPQGKTTVTSAVFGISIYLFILLDLLIIGLSTVNKSDTQFEDEFREGLYLPLVISFSSMLMLYFISSGIITGGKEIYELLLPNYGGIIYQFSAFSQYFPLVSGLSIGLFFALNSKFAKSCKDLSINYLKLSVIVFISLLIISSINSKYLIIFYVLTIFVFDTEKMKEYEDKFPYAFKVICVTSFVVSFIALILNLGTPSFQPQPEVLHGNLSIVIDNVRFVYNNTTMNIQNLTLNVSNVSATYLA